MNEDSKMNKNVIKSKEVAEQIHKNRGSNIIPKNNKRDVFLKLRESGKIPPIRPMKDESTEARRNKKYCEYHKDCGRTTEKCRTLVKTIEQINTSEES